MAERQPRKGYARRGDLASIEMPGPHIPMNQLPMISYHGEVRLLIYKETMKAPLPITFLGETTKRQFPILDRSKADQEEVEDRAAEPPDWGELICLPRPPRS